MGRWGDIKLNPSALEGAFGLEDGPSGPEEWLSVLVESPPARAERRSGFKTAFGAFKQRLWISKQRLWASKSRKWASKQRLWALKQCLWASKQRL